jgi:hypothetical protein
MAEDVKDIQRRLKEMELKAKMGAKAEKQRLREEKMKMKLKKRQEKLEKKMSKKGEVMPKEPLKMERKEEGKPAEKIVSAEVVEFKPKEWERRSVHSMDEVEKKIDRFSGKGVKGLSERYRDKYGEDLKVPELYQIETSLEKDDLERTADEDELGRIDKEMGEASRKEPGGFWGAKKEPELSMDEPKEKLPPNFLDLTTGLFYFKNKTPRGASGGKKTVMILLDIILIIIFPILILRIITTPIYMRKRKKSRAASAEGVSIADA